MYETVPIIEIPTASPGVVMRTRSRADDLSCYQAMQESAEKLAKDTLPGSVNLIPATLSALGFSRIINQRGGQRIFGLHDEDTFVGELKITPARTAASEAEISYWTRTSMEGRGYASLGAIALSTFALQEFKMLYARIRNDNAASRRVAANAGYTLRVTSPDWLVYRRYNPLYEPIDFTDDSNQRAFY